MPTPSNQLQNWTDVTIAWGETTLVIPEVVDVEPNPTGTMVPLNVDGNRFAALYSQQDKVREVTIKGAALNILVLIPQDTPCTITAILNDLNNGTGTGAITFVAVNAILSSNPYRGRNNELGTGEAKFLCYATDDVDPFTSTVAT